MIKTQTFRRSIFIGLLAILTVGTTLVLTTPRTEALEDPMNDCEFGGPGGTNTHTEWLVTPAAQVRTDLGQDCTNAAKPICREECRLNCGENFPQNNFACFAN